jgi:excinuclease UvrABC nuclease subunit
VPLAELDAHQAPRGPGAYLLTRRKSEHLYAGETLNLRDRFEIQFDKRRLGVWGEGAEALAIQTFTTSTQPGDMLAWQSCLVRKYTPRFNYRELRGK